jgi:hypothetical protein
MLARIIERATALKGKRNAAAPRARKTTSKKASSTKTRAKRVK